MKTFPHQIKNVMGVAIGIGLMVTAQSWAGGLHLPMPFYPDVQTMHVYKVYNQDQFEGNWKQLKGALKENWGEFTEDDLLAIEGRADRFEGKLQERYGDRKEEVREWVDKWLENHPYEAEDRSK